MHSTDFRSLILPTPQLASGYELCLGEPMLAELQDPSGKLGASGMLSTGADLLRFDRALAAGRVLSLEMQQVMMSPGSPGWGLGCQLMRIPLPDGKLSYARFHNGDAGGYASHFLSYPPDGFVLLLSSHWTLLSAGRRDLPGAIQRLGAVEARLAGD
jgi:hypothetical protein